MTEPQVATAHRNRDEMAQMVRLISERGPRVDGIARTIGVYNETLRYRYRQMLRRGFAIQASCNYESLGLKRVITIAELDDLFRDCGDTVFNSMGHLAYVTGYARTKPAGHYILSASVPQECLDAWTDLMLDMKKIGIFRSVQSTILDWVRNVPMQAQYFNFDSGDWKFDWKRKSKSPARDTRPGPKQSYDVTDLKIIGQLQINANTPLTEISRKVGAKNYKTFNWHYRMHVLNRGLIKGYRVNWTGAKYGSDSDRSTRMKRRYSWLDIIGNGLSENERLSVMTALNQTPFVWIEGSGSRAILQGLSFLRERRRNC